MVRNLPLFHIALWLFGEAEISQRQGNNMQASSKQEVYRLPFYPVSLHCRRSYIVDSNIQSSLRENVIYRNLTF